MLSLFAIAAQAPASMLLNNSQFLFLGFHIILNRADPKISTIVLVDFPELLRQFFCFEIIESFNYAELLIISDTLQFFIAHNII